MSTKAVSLFYRAILRQATLDSFKKLNPRAQLKNPVMFVTLIGAALTVSFTTAGAEKLTSRPVSRARKITRGNLFQFCIGIGNDKAWSLSV